MEIRTSVLIVRYKENIKIMDWACPTIIVDNTPDENLAISGSNIYYIPLLENKGIAAAQNIGIKRAIELGCTHIIFMDQDSDLKYTYPEEILKEYTRIQQFEPDLFLLGPTIVNGRNGEEYKSLIDRNNCIEGFKRRLDIISSGSCVEISKIKNVGLLDSSLFIDGVDHEWCWRALKYGYICGVTNRVTLTHYVGQNEKRILGLLIIISSPFRYYYQTRNWLWLMRRRYVPFEWKIKTTLKKIFYPMTYPFITKHWLEIYKAIYRGIKDGLKKNCITFE